MDASIRRFRSYKIYMRASAALRWMNARSQLLKGERPTPAHARDLHRISSTMRVVRLESSVHGVKVKFHLKRLD